MRSPLTDLWRQLATVPQFFREPARPAGPNLPQRVRQLIAEQEDESERLIGWVQLLVVGSLGALYLLAPRPADAPPGSLLDPVPAALLAYGLFTVARLWLAHRRRLPGLLLFASILADVGLLLWLIWSFHGQYGQEAPFSLKVPTFVYLFVFIAIRALRFDHRYVLAAGLAAAAGWLMLVLAVLIETGPQGITRSFVAHLNSNRVLIGAEFDKVLALLLVTSVLAFAVYRGRRLFVTAVRDEAAIEDLSRFLGKGVSETVVGAETRAAPGDAVEREAAIVMLDLRGFSRLTAGLSPRRMVEILTSLHARLIPILRAHGGVIDKFLGDGIMATFGAVQPSPRAAAEALAALEAVMVEARAWEAELARDIVGAPVELHGAAVAGPVVFAILGSGQRMEYTVVGEAANLAAKLEKHNKAAGTRALTTLATLAAARRQGYQPKAPVRVIEGAVVTGVEGRLDIAAIDA